MLCVQASHVCVSAAACDQYTILTPASAEQSLHAIEHFAVHLLSSKADIRIDPGMSTYTCCRRRLTPFVDSFTCYPCICTRYCRQQPEHCTMPNCCCTPCHRCTCKDTLQHNHACAKQAAVTAATSQVLGTLYIASTGGRHHHNLFSDSS